MIKAGSSESEVPNLDSAGKFMQGIARGRSTFFLFLARYSLFPIFPYLNSLCQVRLGIGGGKDAADQRNLRRRDLM